MVPQITSFRSGIVAFKSKANEDGPIQMKIRIDAELRASLEASANRFGYSLNREISDRLRLSLSGLVPEPGKFPNSVVGLMRMVVEAMTAAGESALFAKSHSWTHAGKDNWLDDPYAFDQAVDAARAIFETLRPKAPLVRPDVETPWDGKFWEEFFLKQAATGEGNVPENQLLARTLKLHMEEKFGDRIAHFANEDPRATAEKRRSTRKSDR
jgi:hypothetical protein